MTIFKALFRGVAHPGVLRSGDFWTAVAVVIGVLVVISIIRSLADAD